MLQMDGREHIQRRKIVAPQMGGNRLGSFGPVIDDVADGLARAAVAEAVAEGSVDLVARIAHRMPGTVIATMMGLPSDDLPRFFGWYHAMMAGLWTDLELRRRGRVAHHEFKEYLAPIAARSVRPGPDLVSRLVQAEVDGDRMTGEDIGAFMSLLLTAGGDPGPAYGAAGPGGRPARGRRRRLIYSPYQTVGGEQSHRSSASDQERGM